jgi:hypothetical protein
MFFQFRNGLNHANPLKYAYDLGGCMSVVITLDLQKKKNQPCQSSVRLLCLFLPLAFTS